MLDLDDIEAFFNAVLAADSAVMQSIENGPAGARMEQQLFVFSIEALLRLLDPEERMTLQAFKKLIYSSDLNRKLGAKGAEITLFHSTGKVDSNLYCLKTT